MYALIIRAGPIGDLLHIAPAARSLRGMVNNMSGTILAGSRPTASLSRGNPLVDEAIPFDRRGEHGIFPGDGSA